MPVAMIREAIHARRAALAARLETAKTDDAMYDQEIARLHAEQALLHRNMDAMQGGLQELDALLAADKETVYAYSEL